MRIDMLKGISVPSVTCVSVCLLRAILDQAMKGVKIKRNIRAGV